MTLAYRKGALNEANPLSRRPDFVPQATVPLFWDGEVPSDRELRGKSQLLFEDVQLNLMTVNALQQSHEFVDLIREGYSQDSFHGDEGKCTSIPTGNGTCTGISIPKTTRSHFLYQPLSACAQIYCASLLSLCAPFIATVAGAPYPF
jgi:hypothetical protein